MTELHLQRYNYADTETEGRLWIDDETFFYTLERPWKDGMPGGMPFESCVPDGSYALIPHTRPNGHEVYALRNPALDVYYTAEERGERPGRYLILIHAGNYVDDVVGCVAPGTGRTIYRNRRMVTSSRKAMGEIMKWHWDTLIIESAMGAMQ